MQLIIMDGIDLFQICFYYSFKMDDLSYTLMSHSLIMVNQFKDIVNNANSSISLSNICYLLFKCMLIIFYINYDKQNITIKN